LEYLTKRKEVRFYYEKEMYQIKIVNAAVFLSVMQQLLIEFKFGIRFNHDIEVGQLILCLLFIENQ
jgi:hypothetical protein